jgi:hypothetical protein
MMMQDVFADHRRKAEYHARAKKVTADDGDGPAHWQECHVFPPNTRSAPVIPSRARWAPAAALRPRKLGAWLPPSATAFSVPNHAARPSPFDFARRFPVKDEARGAARRPRRRGPEPALSALPFFLPKEAP